MHYFLFSDLFVIDCHRLPTQAANDLGLTEIYYPIE
jgi:hypothetical protein